jgi:hypothetical protein
MRRVFKRATPNLNSKRSAWETGFSVIFRILTFIFGIYVSIIGTTNYFINKSK